MTDPTDKHLPLSAFILLYSLTKGKKQRPRGTRAQNRNQTGHQAVFGANNVELFVALQDGQDSLRFEFSRVLFSWHDSNLRFHYYYYIMHS